MKLNPNKYYSLRESQKFLGIKSRQYISKYIKEKKLTAVVLGGSTVGAVRYAIKGEHIQSFLDRKEKGLLERERFTKGEFKLMVMEILDYCEKNGIKTLKGLKLCLK